MVERSLRNIVISSYGAKLCEEKNLLKISYRKDDETVNMLVSPREVEQVIVTGEASITSSVIRLLLEHNVDLVFVKQRPRFYARIVRSDTNFSDLWRKLIELSTEKKLEISIEVVDCGIYNKNRLLQSLYRNRGIQCRETTDRLNRLRESARVAGSRETLFGVEGSAARVYWQALDKLIPEKLGFDGREKHPPTDPVNSLLSYGYTVLQSRVEYSLMLAGLNIYEGIYHKPYRDRSALGFDLIEEFRQPIVDRVVLSMISQGQVSSKAFTTGEEMCWIGRELKRLFLDALYSRLEDLYDWNGEKHSFQDIMILQARRLADTVMDNSMYVGFKYR